MEYILKEWNLGEDYNGYPFTFGNTPACIKLMEVIKERPDKRYETRKIQGAIHSFSKSVKSIVVMKADYSIKVNLLRLVYEDKRNYIEGLLYGQPFTDFIMYTLAKNIIQMKYGEALKEVKRKDKEREQKIINLENIMKTKGIYT
jgi:hypothetical protein